MAFSSPKHGLTKVARGWVRRVDNRPKWICSDKVAPTAVAADEYYERHFSDLWRPSAPVEPGAATVGYLADAWYERKTRAAIGARTLAATDESLADFVKLLGYDRAIDSLAPADFAKVRAAMAKRFGPHRLRSFIKLIRAMFKWATKPPLRLRVPDYGDEFQVPGKAVFRLHNKRNDETYGLKLFEPEEVRKLLAGTRGNMRAMILLALNAGYGNADVARLPLSILNLEKGILDYAREKTGIARRVILWPETIEALRVALKVRERTLTSRKIAPAVAKLVFITNQGQPYHVARDGGKRNSDRVGANFMDVCERLGMERFGRSFYSLRRTFRTIADEMPDTRAINLIMGHAGARDQGGTYVMRISDERIRAITDHVRQRLLVSQGL